ncbi:BlaI/MecI/CopY family transcriptional regulator [Actinocorallia longicatena]|uniref:BlaI/MecI/CopY family transcriptional regulator n=1 Tax=Actinocorallia longicatena TaxID=111803 RepID=A0ABP6Q0Y2_9ACTN
MSASSNRRGWGALEAEIMAALAASDTALGAGELREILDPPPAYTTVLTALSRLHDKGAVTRDRSGRGHVYSFQRDEAALRAVQMRRLLEGGKDKARVLARFVDELSPEHERLLQRLLSDLDGP